MGATLTTIFYKRGKWKEKAIMPVVEDVETEDIMNEY